MSLDHYNLVTTGFIYRKATLFSMSRFIHLRVHTEYSLLEGAMRLKIGGGVRRYGHACGCGDRHEQFVRSA